ncbi:MAG: serine hydroxymethyltransferase, partial [Armatimonadota bacterium]
LRPYGVTGKTAQIALDEAAITTNKNSIPFDPEKMFVTSGIRLGTPAVTTRGMKEPEMKQIADFISDALRNHDNAEKLHSIRQQVIDLTKQFPIHIF